jgi:hypothetical protein
MMLKNMMMMRVTKPLLRLWKLSTKRKPWQWKLAERGAKHNKLHNA